MALLRALQNLNSDQQQCRGMEREREGDGGRDTSTGPSISGEIQDNYIHVHRSAMKL